MSERISETIHLDNPQECFDETNPNHYLTVAERERLEADYAAWRNIEADEPHSGGVDYGQGEEVWKWSWIRYNKLKARSA